MMPRPDQHTGEIALDDLSRLGVTGMFTRMASRFEHTATELDRRGDGVARLTLVQDDSCERRSVRCWGCKLPRRLPNLPLRAPRCASCRSSMGRVSSPG